MLVRRAGWLGGQEFSSFRGFVDVDRFFSKLDLRDIKIDPFKASYPPDAEDVVEAGMDHLDERETSGQSLSGTRQPHTPAWAPPVEAEPVYAAESVYTQGNGYDNEAEAYGNGYAEDAAPLVEQQQQRNGDVLKVSARSRPSAVAGAIAGVVRENGRAEVQAIGAGATNQAVKAVAIARDYLRETGIEAICLPAFIDVTIENEDRTAIRLVVEPR